MSDPNPVPTHPLLTSFALGPSWARATANDRQSSPQKASASPKPEPRRGQRNEKSQDGPPQRQGRDARQPRDHFDREGKRPSRGHDRNQPRAGQSPRREEVLPAPNIQVTLLPEAQAVHLIGNEIRQVARVYPLIDVAKILLAERARCLAVFEARAPHPGLYLQSDGSALFLTREEAFAHLWNSELRQQWLEEEVVEVDPPSGNFQLVARCGMSGEWLGPPNYHAYQSNLRRLHRERFANLPFAVYASRVRTERGEEAVNAWLETMKQKTRWRLKNQPDQDWTDDRAEAERRLSTSCFDQVFSLVQKATVSAAISPKHLSPALMASLKATGNHARNHPAVLIPAACRALEAEHLPVFKRQGKIFTGPARPLPLPANAVLAERPGIMVNWIRNHKPAKLEGLWQAVLPEGGTAPPAEFAADLFWLLLQGHVLLFTDDTLMVQEARDPNQTSTSSQESTAAAASNKRKKKKKTKTAAQANPANPDQSVATADPAPDAEPEAKPDQAVESADPVEPEPLPESHAEAADCEQPMQQG